MYPESMKPISRKRKLATIFTTIAILAALAFAVVVDQWLLVDLPRPDELYQYTTAPSTKIYDRHGTLLYEITDPHQGLHTPLTLEDIPAACIEATIATDSYRVRRLLAHWLEEGAVAPV